MKKTKLVLISTLALLICMSQITYASTQEDKRLKAAMELIDVTFNPQAIYKIIDYVGKMSISQSFNSNPKTKQYSAVLTDITLDVMKEAFYDPKSINKLKQMYANIYAQEFTAKELNEMAAFYKTPTGKKTLAKLPAVIQRSQQQAAKFTSSILTPEYKQKLENKIQKLQDEGKLPSDL